MDSLTCNRALATFAHTTGSGTAKLRFVVTTPLVAVPQHK